MVGGGVGVPPGSGSRNGSEHGLGVERVQSTGLGVVEAACDFP